MVRIALSTLFVLGFSMIYAQDSLRSKNFLSFSVGGSFATGNYGSSVSSLQGSGFATSGFLYQFEYAGFWSKHAGFGFEAGHFSNAVNLNSYSNDFAANFQGLTPPNTVLVTSIDNWKATYLLGGPYITLPFKDLIIDFKALGGMVNSTIPGFT